MIKGLAITPPVLGRISIGRVVEKNGKRLPEKDDPGPPKAKPQLATAGAFLSAGHWFIHMNKSLGQNCATFSPSIWRPSSNCAITTTHDTNMA